MMKNIVMVISLSIYILMSILPAHAAENQPNNIYVVKPGDTLPGIAKKYETTVEELILTNGLPSEHVLSGQKLLVPFMYEVAAGDSLREIASAYHSSVDLIKATNGLVSDQINAGQILKISPKRMVIEGQYILMTKEEFRDWLFHNEFSRKINLIQQHHTWMPSYKQFNGYNHFKLMKSMERFHKTKMGWKNIAQNLSTFPDGKVVVARPFNIAPEGTIGYRANATGIAIENIGNFDIGHDVMTYAQKETIVYVTALLCIKFGLTPSVDSITYHHWWNLRTGERVLDKGPEYNVKSCPGTGFFGGNSTTSAINNFYPLVTRKMQEISASQK